MTITVKYSCSQCGINRQPVEVPARTSEDVVWTEQVMAPALSRDHDERSPGCVITKLSEVLVPMTGASKIGGPPLQ